MPKTLSTLASYASILLGACALNIPRAQQAAADSVPYDGCRYNVAGTGSFMEHLTWTFPSGSSGLPSGLYASDYTVNDRAGNANAPYNHRFVPSNVYPSGGYLNLKVPGGQSPSSSTPINSAEVVTTRDDILYASIRWKAIFSDVAGTCQGAFLYASDNAEIDIEFLSDPTSQSNTGSRPNPLWYTNQKATSSSPTTAVRKAGAANETYAINEYRIDWIKGQTKFYLNGNLQNTFTQNVPTIPAPFILNNWSNGDRGWSVGPPASDNIFKIQSIDMYFNSTSGPKTCK